MPVSLPLHQSKLGRLLNWQASGLPAAEDTIDMVSPRLSATTVAALADATRSRNPPESARHPTTIS